MHVYIYIYKNSYTQYTHIIQTQTSILDTVDACKFSSDVDVE